MKKRLVFLFLSILSVFLFSQENENPFVSIMGMKWGTTASELKEKLKNVMHVYMPKKPAVLELYHTDFPFMVTEDDPLCYFVFKSKEKGLKFKEENYSLFYLDSAFQDIYVDFFDHELHDLTRQLGKPSSEKKYIIKKKGGTKLFHNEVTWINGDRKITLFRGMDGPMYTCTIFYNPINKSKKF
jgi:hypothetical protein